MSEALEKLLRLAPTSFQGFCPTCNTKVSTESPVRACAVCKTDLSPLLIVLALKAWKSRRTPETATDGASPN